MEEERWLLVEEETRCPLHLVPLSGKVLDDGHEVRGRDPGWFRPACVNY